MGEMQLHGARSGGSSFYSCDEGSAAEDAFGIPEEVYLLRFRGGDGTLFREALLDGPQFRQCREEMERQGFHCVLPSQALLFVKPEQCADVMEAIADRDLHPFHIIITKHFEYLLDEV